MSTEGETGGLAGRLGLTELLAVLERHFPDMIIADLSGPARRSSVIADLVTAGWLGPAGVRAREKKAWDLGYGSGKYMAKCWGHVDYWEDEAPNPYADALAPTAEPEPSRLTKALSGYEPPKDARRQLDILTGRPLSDEPEPVVTSACELGSHLYCGGCSCPCHTEDDKL